MTLIGGGGSETNRMRGAIGYVEGSCVEGLRLGDQESDKSLGRAKRGDASFTEWWFWWDARQRGTMGPTGVSLGDD